MNTIKKLREFVCFHSALEVIRWHPNVVPEEWKNKLLYTDVHNVSNFIRCCNCKKIFNGMQDQHLYERHYAASEVITNM